MWLDNSNSYASSKSVLNFLRSTFQVVECLSAPATALVVKEKSQDHTPTVSARKNLANPEHIISMIDGKSYKTLRHLARSGFTADEYRERYGLKADYPMIAPAYSDSRRAMTKQIGLERKPARSKQLRRPKCRSRNVVAADPGPGAHLPKRRDPVSGLPRMALRDKVGKPLLATATSKALRYSASQSHSRGVIDMNR